MDTRSKISRARALGTRNEERFFEAAGIINKRSDPRVTVPNWLVGIDRPSREEDRLDGVDAVAYTDRGLIEIQIKSSSAHIGKFRRNHPNFRGVILIMFHDCEPHEIAIQCIIHLRNHYQTRRHLTYVRLAERA